jgi:hypothetical protein
LQFAVEPIGAGPIYKSIGTTTTRAEINMQSAVILKFLADSRRYLDR